MQTTLAIDDDVLAAAEQIAARQHQTVGEVISELSRRSLPHHDLASDTDHDVPMLPRTPNSSRVTFEMVEHLKDELVG